MNVQDGNQGRSRALELVPRQLHPPFLAALVQDFPLGVAILDREGRFLFVNAATARLDGASVDAHIGRHIRELVPDLWGQADRIFKQVLRGAVVELEVSGETPAAPGVTRCWSEHWFPIRGDEDEVAAVGVTILEKTEQKRAEAALTRTAEWQHRLVRLASHELRGPLTSVLGFTQRLLRRPDLPATVRDEVGLVLDQAELIRDRLEMFVRAAEGQELDDDTHLEWEEVDLLALVERELEIHQRQGEGVPFELEYVTSPRIVSNAGRIREILGNLLDNAGKYGEGTVVMRIVEERGWVRLEVEDDGPGVPEELAAPIFEPDIRGRGVRSERVPGQGLGLYVAQRLAAQLGGTLLLLTRPPKGALFALRIPKEPPHHVPSAWC